MTEGATMEACYMRNERELVTVRVTRTRIHVIAPTTAGYQE